MIIKYVDRFVKGVLPRKHYDYDSLVQEVIRMIHQDNYWDPDPESMTTIISGEYQGTYLFVFKSHVSDFWSVKMHYGSCSYCDTIESIRGMADWNEDVTDEQYKKYCQLALHVIQNLKEI